MDPAVGKVIRRTSILTGALGVILSPIPLADELLLFPIYGVMTSRIGKTHGLTLRDLPWKPIATTACAGLAARAALNLTVAYIPGVAAAANAVSAVALTQFFGRYVDGICENPGAARALSMQEILTTLKNWRSEGKPAT